MLCTPRRKCAVMLSGCIQISFRLKNNLNEIDHFWAEIEMLLKNYCLTKKEIFQINMSVEELFTNIVSYAFKDDNEHWIDINLEAKKNEIVICMEDKGIPFNPLESMLPNCKAPLSRKTEGGLGIHFCRTMMNTFSYERSGDKNIVTIKKKLKKIGFLKKIFSCRRKNGN